MLGTALARGLGCSGARVWGSSRLAVVCWGKTSGGYSVPLGYKGPAWVLEVGKELAKYPGHGSQRGSVVSGQVFPSKSQGHDGSFILRALGSSSEKCR